MKGERFEIIQKRKGCVDETKWSFLKEVGGWGGKWVGVVSFGLVSGKRKGSGGGGDIGSYYVHPHSSTTILGRSALIMWPPWSK